LSVEIDRLRIDFASASEKFAKLDRANRAQLAERIDSIHDLQREIERLRHDFALVSEKHALAEQGKRLLEAQVAERIEAIHALGREIERLRRDFASVSQQYALVAQDRQMLQGELVEREKFTHELEGELARMRASHSWLVTAPLRWARRALDTLGSGAWSGAKPVIRPLAHLLRPLLRTLSRSSGARRVALFALGRNSAAARHLRLFLFGRVAQVPEAPRIPAPCVDAELDPAPPIRSRRQRGVLNALKDARLRAAAGEERSCE